MIQQQIKQKLVAHFAPVYCDVLNESSQHNVPAGSDTHFKVIVVADEFSGMSRLARHQAVYAVLQAELSGLIKALSVSAFAPNEWQGAFAPSPPCMGGRGQS